MSDQFVDPVAEFIKEEQQTATQTAQNASPIIPTQSAQAQVEDAWIQPSDTALDSDTSFLPTVGAVAGGMYAASKGVPQVLQKASKAIPGVPGKLVQGATTLLPSMLGTAGGTTVGTIAEQQLEGRDTVSYEGLAEIAKNSATEVAWDAGGNLVFSLAGKTFRVTKDVLNKAAGGLAIDVNPRLAAQTFISKYGGTLTGGQFAGGMREVLEGFVDAPWTRSYFKRQQEGLDVGMALAVSDLKKMLPGTPNFVEHQGNISGQLFGTLLEREGADQAKGSFMMDGITADAVSAAFRESISATQKALSDSVAPFYAKLDQVGSGVRINFKDIKEIGQNAIAKERATPVLEASPYLKKLAGMGNNVTFAQLHEIRSDLVSRIMSESNAVRMGQKGADPSGLDQMKTVLNKIDDLVDEQAQHVLSRNQNLASEYREITSFYKQSKRDIFGETLTQSLIYSPEGVAKLLYGSANTKILSETLQSVKTAAELSASRIALSEGLEKGTSKYIKRVKEIKANPDKFNAISETSIMNDLRQGYVAEFFHSPDAIVQWSKKFETDPKVKAVAYGLFKDNPKALEVLEGLANTAKYGKNKTDPSIGIRQMIIGQTASTAVQLLTVAPAVIATLGAEDKQSVMEALGTSALSAGGLVIGSRGLAKALTNKEATNALARLQNFNTKMTGGAVFKGIIEPLIRSGAFDTSEGDVQGGMSFAAPLFVDPASLQFTQ